MNKELKKQNDFSNSIKKILATILAAKNEIQSCNTKIDEENKKFDLNKKNFDSIIMTEKIELMHSFILENHNSKIEDIGKIKRRLERLKKRCEIQAKLLSAINKEDIIEENELKSKFVLMIQQDCISQIEDDIKVLRQRKIKFIKYNKYLDYLEKNDYKEEYEKYKGGQISCDKIEQIEEEKNNLIYYQTKLLAILKNDAYSFKNKDLFSDNLLGSDVIKIIEVIYPNFKDIRLEQEEKLRKVS